MDSYTILVVDDEPDLEGLVLQRMRRESVDALVIVDGSLFHHEYIIR